MKKLNIKGDPRQLIINSLVDQQKEFTEWYDNTGLINISNRHVHLTSEYFTELFGDDYEIDVDGFLNDSQFTISRYVDGVKFIAVVDINDHYAPADKMIERNKDISTVAIREKLSIANTQPDSRR